MPIPSKRKTSLFSLAAVAIACFVSERPIAAKRNPIFRRLQLAMEVSASELFWKLIEQKAGIVPDTKKPVYTKEFKPKEASWSRFKAVSGALIVRLYFIHEY